MERLAFWIAAAIAAATWLPAAAMADDWCCQEGWRSGNRNCKVLVYDFEEDDSDNYWVNVNYSGVFRRRTASTCQEGVKSGSRNCKVKYYDFASENSSTYWVSARWSGVFRRAYQCDMPTEACSANEYTLFEERGGLQKLCWWNGSSYRWHVVSEVVDVEPYEPQCCAATIQDDGSIDCHHYSYDRCD